MGEKKMAALGFGIITVIIIIIVGVILAVTNTGETKTENDTKETVKDFLNKGIDEGWISQPESQQELDITVDEMTSSLSEYQKTNEILESYSTVGIIEDILDDKTTALDDRIEYHSMTEPKDNMREEDLLYIAGEIEYEVTACEQNTHPTGIAGLMESLRFELEYMIKSGYAKDPSIMPLLQRAKVAINAYSDCIDKSGNQ